MKYRREGAMNERRRRSGEFGTREDGSWSGKGSNQSRARTGTGGRRNRGSRPPPATSESRAMSVRSRRGVPQDRNADSVSVDGRRGAVMHAARRTVLRDRCRCASSAISKRAADRTTGARIRYTGTRASRKLIHDSVASAARQTADNGSFHLDTQPVAA